MSWIDEMISIMRRNKAGEESKDAARNSQASHVETADKQISGAKEAWTELLLRLKSDVKEFNGDKARAGHSAVLMSSEHLSIEHFQFEVYLPEMDSKLFVLTMNGNNLDVEVRPEFPGQKCTIAVQAGSSGKGYHWILAGLEKDRELTARQLSEYLLKPVLSTATID